THRSLVRTCSGLSNLLFPAPALRHRHGRRVGRGSFAHHGVDPCEMAGAHFRAIAGRLCAGILARSRGVPPCLSALGVAPAVFCRRTAGAAYAFCPRKSERARSLAPFAHGLGELPPSDIRKLAALCLSRGADGHGELHLSRHTRQLPHLLAAPRDRQSAASFRISLGGNSPNPCANGTKLRALSLLRGQK